MCVSKCVWWFPSIFQISLDRNNISMNSRGNDFKVWDIYWQLLTNVIYLLHALIWAIDDKFHRNRYFLCGQILLPVISVKVFCKDQQIQVFKLEGLTVFESHLEKISNWFIFSVFIMHLIHSWKIRLRMQNQRKNNIHKSYSILRL